MKMGLVSSILDGWTYEGSRQKILDSITLSKRYLDQFVI